GREQHVRGLTACTATVGRAGFPLIHEALGKRASKLVGRTLGIRRVVAASLSSQEMVHHMMSIIIPLGVIPVPKQGRRVVVILQHEVNLPSGKALTQPYTEVAKPLLLADDRMDGIKT